MKKYTTLVALFLFSSIQIYASDLLIAGTLDFCDGLGKIPYGIIDHLGRELAITYNTDHVCTFYYDPFNLRSRVNKVAGFDDADMFLYTNPLVTLLSNDCYKQVPESTVKLAYTMFEADRIPEECVNCLNKEFDALVVPDPYWIGVYEASGIKKPMYCVPTGLYLETLLNFPTKEPEEGPFIFGCASTDVFRKNLRTIVDAFIQKYGNNPDYALHLHVKYAFYQGDDSLEAYIEERGIENIEIIDDTLSDEEFIDFLRSLDCYILLSRGEGFSNTPREAMALGVPCILSNNTGHKTICDSGYVVPVECNRKIPGWYEALSRTVGCQFECDVDDVIIAMEKVVSNYDFYFDQAQNGREWVERYIWPKLKQDYLTLFDPAHVVVGSQNKLDTKTRTIYTTNKTFADKLQTIIEKRKAEVTLAAPSGFCDGIGRIGYGIIDSLSNDIAIKSYHFPQHADNYKGYMSFDDPYQVKNRVRMTTHLGEPKTFVYIDSINGLLGDTCYQKLSDKTVKFAYSMFESSRIPQKAVAALNSYFDAVIVPDPYHIKVYQDSGVVKPIFCIPTGLYLERFLAEPIKEFAGKPFTFACIATNSPRKNVKKIIEAFGGLYGNNSNYQLKLHIKKPTMNDVKLDMMQQNISKLFERVEGVGAGSLGDFFNSLPDAEETAEEMVQRLGLTNVVITSEIMTEKAYIEYFKGIDCYVSVSTGEGFSNTPREAMALGIPCIVSNNTAQKTICKSGCVIPVESLLEVNAKYSEFSEDLGKQYDCAPETLENALRDAVENYTQHLEKGVAAREWVKQYLWPNLKQDYLTLLKPKRVILGSENRIDCKTGTVITTDPVFYSKAMVL